MLSSIAMLAPQPCALPDPRQERRFCNATARLSVRCLYTELVLYPKPGLVSPVDNGSHTDMTAATFMRSLFALRHYFARICRAGVDNAPFAVLRQLGIDAEARMLRASGGVNTHRGAIWALGLLVTAAAQGPLRTGETAAQVRAAGIAQQVASRAGTLARQADRAAPRRTGNKGELARLAHGVGGARGQAEEGFPQVTQAALPMLRLSRARGDAEDACRLNALLAVMVELDDTCLLARGGAGALAASQQGARRVLDAGGAGTSAGKAALRELEADMRARHISPGGAADLLAAALLLDRIETQQVLKMEWNHGETAV
jgi:triphosphoribosyl-dephospho-CoA synthase